MKIRVAGIEDESVVDGDGYRLVIFTQGCPHHCPGCHNPQTWDFNGGYEMESGEIFKRIEKNPLLAGVTFSGGEPFEKAEALFEIAKKVHEMNLNVWSYTGYTYETLLKKGGAAEKLLNEIDVLIDGPFLMAERDLTLRFRGSKNQRVIDMKKTRERGAVTLLYND